MPSPSFGPAIDPSSDIDMYKMDFATAPLPLTVPSWATVSVHTRSSALNKRFVIVRIHARRTSSGPLPVRGTTVRALQGNKAETATMLPVLEEFMTAHQLSSITVIADAGTISEANQQAILRARPIYHRKRDSIEAHLTIVLAAMAVSDWIEQTTGWSIKKFVRTARRYRTVTIRAGTKTITAAQHHPKTSQLPSPRSTQPSVRTRGLGSAEPEF